MAERRMFSKKIISSARFLRMPATARLLYYDLGMHADDDGIVEAFTVIQLTRAAEDDLRVLVSKGFIQILDNDLVSLITDWKTNNLIRKDRYTPSIYHNLLPNLNNDYPAISPEQDDIQQSTNVQPTVNQRLPQERKGKDRIDKVRLGKENGDENEDAAQCFDSSDSNIREFFKKTFFREADKSFMTSIKTYLGAGIPEKEILNIIEQTATKSPEIPEAYIIAIIKQHQEVTRQAVTSAYVDDPTRPLEQWEQEWIEEVKKRRAERKLQALGVLAGNHG